MNLPKGIGEEAINKIISEHPAIGTILHRHEIGCVTCGVGICLLKDVVSIHALGSEAEAQIEREITEYLESLDYAQKGAAA
jgi:hypothetical protein